MKAKQARRDLSRRAAGVLILRLGVASFCQNACRVLCRAASKATHSNRNDASRELRADGGAHLTCPTLQRPAYRCRHGQASSPTRGTSCTPSQAPVCAACTARSAQGVLGAISMQCCISGRQTELASFTRPKHVKLPPRKIETQDSTNITVCGKAPSARVVGSEVPRKKACTRTVRLGEPLHKADPLCAPSQRMRAAASRWSVVSPPAPECKWRRAARTGGLPHPAYHIH